MSNHLKTIYHDLNALKHLLNYRDSTNFSVVLSYSFIRDACVILHEIHQVMKNQGIIEEETESMKKIEQIRHKVKTSQGKYNKSYFEFMLNMHRDIFGSDIDNIGFYFEEKILAVVQFIPASYLLIQVFCQIMEDRRYMIFRLALERQ